MSSKALVRDRVEVIDGVSRSWFEHERRNGVLTRTLVVEVEFDTDPNSPGCSRLVLEEIEKTVDQVLGSETTMVISGLRIVPKDVR